MTKHLESRHQTISFGKYKGKTVGEVLLDDPSYILWLVDETDIDVAIDIVDEAQDNFDDETYHRDWY